MRSLLDVKVYLTAKIGRCSKCMRQSLQLMLLSWTALAVAAFVPSDGTAFFVIAALAAGSTALWLLHILTFARRRLAARLRGAVDPVPVAKARAMPAVPPPTAGRSLARRDMLRVFLRGLLTAAAASLPLRTASARCGDCARTFGAGTYDCITSFCNTIGQYCCPSGYPYLNHCDCECYNGTNFDCRSYSDCHYCS